MNSDPRTPLDELPDEVYAASREVYHALAADGRTVCGMRLSEPRRNRHPADNTPLRSRPCQECFTADLVEEHTPADATTPPRES